MKTLETIRYMGIKTQLLDEIIPAIRSVTPSNGVVLDLMAGSNAVSYALKEYFTVYANDAQEYSYVISKAVIENSSEIISKKSAEVELSEEKIYKFFEETYSGTYFSQKQCEYIDSIRYAIEQSGNEYRKSLYLFALMRAMCKVQSAPGHFAQFMPENHPRVVPLQRMNIYKEFLLTCDDFSNLYLNKNKNMAFCLDYKDLFKNDCLKNVNTIYLDSPYSQEQYSRFYHVLETLVKYDNPKVDFKAKYRENRFMSGFCYKNRVKDEFSNILKFCFENNKNLVISYSDKAVLDSNELKHLCEKYFSK